MTRVSYRDAWRAEEIRVLQEAWPEGVPPLERALLASLKEEMRNEVLARLDAVNRASAGESPETLAVHLGVGRASFFKMRRRWRAEKTLAVLVPRAKRKGGRPKLAPNEVSSENLNRGAAPPDAACSAGMPSDPTVRRMRREKQREEATKPEVLLERFGSVFALDLTALDIPISIHGEIQWAGGAFFLELQSGLILAGVVGSLAESDVISRRAFELGCALATNNQLRVQPGPVLEAVVGDGAISLRSFAHYLQWLQSVTYPEHLYAAGNQRFGRFLLNAVGRRLGRVRLKPRTTARTAKILTSGIQGRSAVSVENAQILLDEEIRRYNEPIEAQLVALGLLSGSGNGGLSHAFDVGRRANAR